eukprot:4858213-Pleurochrysis_carterae.AAC.1
MGVHGATFQDDLPPQIVVCSNLHSLYEVEGGVAAVAEEMAELTNTHGWYAKAPDDDPLALLTLPGARVMPRGA